MAIWPNALMLISSPVKSGLRSISPCRVSMFSVAVAVAVATRLLGGRGQLFGGFGQLPASQRCDAHPFSRTVASHSRTTASRAPISVPWYAAVLSSRVRNSPAALSRPRQACRFASALRSRRSRSAWRTSRIRTAIAGIAAPPTPAASGTPATYRETSGIEAFWPGRRPSVLSALWMRGRRLIGAHGLGDWLRSGVLPDFADQYLDRASGGYGQERRHEGAEDTAP